MESIVHLRKGRTPRRLHADLDGLKDDELGRGGFTGRTANMYRRHDPTAYRAGGPLRPVDVLSTELKPGDATDAAGGPMLLFSNPHYPPPVDAVGRSAGQRWGSTDGGSHTREVRIRSNPVSGCLPK